MIKENCPRDNGQGCKIPKMHSLSKILYYVRKFGNAKVFSGENGERVLKSIVKDPGCNT